MDLLAYRHSRARFSMSLPPTWERIEDPRETLALVALEPDRQAGFRANLVVTLDRLPPGLDLDGWQSRAEDLLPRTLNDFLLLDRERLERDDRVTMRRLFHHAAPDHGAVTVEQWATLDDGVGYTLSASIGTLAYDSLADLFAEVGRTFRPATGEANA